MSYGITHIMTCLMKKIGELANIGMLISFLLDNYPLGLYTSILSKDVGLNWLLSCKLILEFYPLYQVRLCTFVALLHILSQHTQSKTVFCNVNRWFYCR